MRSIRCDSHRGSWRLWPGQAMGGVAGGSDAPRPTQACGRPWRRRPQVESLDQVLGVSDPVLVRRVTFKPLSTSHWKVPVGPETFTSALPL